MKTIKAVAQEIGVSKQAVFAEIDKQGLRSCLTKSGNSFTIDDDTERLIIQGFASRGQGNALRCLTSIDDKDLTINDKQLTIDLQREIDARDAEIDRLRDEIRRMQDHADDLSKMILSLQENLKAEQTLHARALLLLTAKEDDTAANLEDKQPPEDAKPQEERHRPWWRFWA